MIAPPAINLCNAERHLAGTQRNLAISEVGHDLRGRAAERNRLADEALRELKALEEAAAAKRERESAAIYMIAGCIANPPQDMAGATRFWMLSAFLQFTDSGSLFPSMELPAGSPKQQGLPRADILEGS